MNDQSLAWMLASVAHIDQLDKQGHAYMHHIAGVYCNLIHNENLTEAHLIVAILHDVIEDTAITLEKLKKLGFSQDILDALSAISKRDGEDYEDYILRVALNPIAATVKLADLGFNLSTLWMLDLSDQERLYTKYINAYNWLWKSIYGGKQNSETTDDLLDETSFYHHVVGDNPLEAIEWTIDRLLDDRLKTRLRLKAYYER